MKRVLAVVLLLLVASAARAQTLTLVQQVSIPGSFLTSQSIWVDGTYVYAGSFEGQLHVHHNSPGLPHKHTINLGLPVRAIRSNNDYAYITTALGDLYRFRKQDSWMDSVHLDDAGAWDADVKATVLVSVGQARMARSQKLVFLNQLGPGDYGMVVDRSGLWIRRVVGQQFAASDLIRVFDYDAVEVQTLQSPYSGSVALYANKRFLAVTSPGCCGAGVVLYKITAAGATYSTTLPIPFANTVIEYYDPVARKQYLIVGTESGGIHLVDVKKKGFPIVASIDLRAVTGYNGPDDIEVRSLAVDAGKGLIYAGSTWSNQTLPSLYIVSITP